MSTEGTPDPASQPSDPVGGDATPSAEPPAPEPAAPVEHEAAASYPPVEPEPSPYVPAEPEPSSYPPPEYAQPPYAPPYGPGGPAEPGYQQPGYQQPGYQQPGYQQPGYQQPGYQQPGYQQPGYQQPGYQQPAYPPAYGPAPLSPSDERLWATLAHVGPILTSFLAPLLIWLILRDRSRFVDDQGKEALNFQIFLAIVYVVGVLTTFILIGFLILPAAWILSIVFGIQGAIVAGRGELYRYPLTWRVIK
jgi:uncharacterized Tic20 family protein